MDPETRAARGGRDRSKPFQSDKARRTWEKRAEKFERDGNRLMDKAMKKPVITGSQGPQIAPEFRMAKELLRLADQLWARLGRVGPPDGKPPKPDPTKPRSLADYRRA